MPELPEVETIRRQLLPQLHGRRILTGRGTPSPKFVEAEAAADRVVTDVRRRGKYLLVDLDDTHELVVHLGMTGTLAVVGDEVPADPYRRAEWALDDGRILRFRDVRQFGRLGVVPRGHHERFPTLHHLGPEPFDPELDASFATRLRRSDRRIKTQLLSQRPVAGVGNIYADEALWRAGINPAARRLGDERAAALLSGLREALAEGIANGGTTLRDYRDATGGRGRNQDGLRCYGRAGQPCPRCATPLTSRVLDQRTTTSCPRCQRR